jgi:hypothetical protein
LSTETVAPNVERKRFLNAYPAAEDAHSYDERPLLLEHIDPQLFLSRNSVPQPFFLVCEKDTVLTALSGEAIVEFRECSLLHHRLVAGDFVYVPAGTPHRIVPSKPGLHLRYKARVAELEGVATARNGTRKPCCRKKATPTRAAPTQRRSRARRASNAAQPHQHSTLATRAGTRWPPHCAGHPRPSIRSHTSPVVHRTPRLRLSLDKLGMTYGLEPGG